MASATLSIDLGADDSALHETCLRKRDAQPGESARPAKKHRVAPASTKRDSIDTPADIKHEPVKLPVSRSTGTSEGSSKETAGTPASR
ncbi:hypothetical protein HBI40_216340 [Parastagonospora nodorum]|nr:hypothetical protein HBI40_216340 [Parastagonospora nodorum]